MLPAKAVVLLIFCFFLGNGSAKLTSDANRELKEALQEIIDNEAEEGSPEISDDNDDIDILSKKSNDKYEATKEAIAKAKEQLEEEFLRRNKFFKDGTDKPPSGQTAAAMAGLNDLQYGSEGEHKENRTLINLFATRILLEDKFSSLEQLLKNKQVRKAFSDEEGDCDEKNNPIYHLDCDSAKTSPYRTINGTCNNIDNPMWGAPFTAQIRNLPAEYENEVDSPRTTGVGGGALPSARTVSITALRDDDNLETPDDDTRSVMVMAFGQFLDHDIAETPMTKGRKDTTVGCCVLEEAVRETRDTQCFTIDVESDDPQFDTDCLDLVRSLPASENPCRPGAREQFNAITAFIDGSAVYGSEDHLAESLRTMTDGRMKIENIGGSKVLPRNEDQSACVLDDATNAHCLLAGDIRVNENPFLAMLHTAFVIYHNKLAESIASKDSTLTDEEIYQIARKIIGAIIQHVTYTEWLPEVLGADAMKKYKLDSRKKDPYKLNTNPSIQNEFSTAALRHGHSMIVSELLRLNENLAVQNPPIPLESVFFNPDLLFRETQVPQLMRWLASFPCKKTDPFMVQAIQDRLFNGTDLAALNIQRGREHGLPGYTKYRKLCGLSVPESFDELDDHTELLKEKLKKAYDHVDDIDLFVGGMSEMNSADDANIGNTFSCLLGLQFQALKEGDRYWYERDEPEGFTPDQLENIKTFHLSKLLCDVFGLPEIQENIFRLPKVTDLESCPNWQGVDISLWV